MYLNAVSKIPLNHEKFLLAQDLFTETIYDCYACHYSRLFNNYSSLFVTIRHYSHYSRLFAIRYLGFPNTRLAT